VATAVHTAVSILLLLVAGPAAGACWCAALLLIGSLVITVTAQECHIILILVLQEVTQQQQRYDGQCQQQSDKATAATGPGQCVLVSDVLLVLDAVCALRSQRNPKHM
jgi:hypothetical protein